MATVKIAYAAAVELAFAALGALAASATWVAGAESGVVDNSANLYDDFLLAGNFKTGAANAKIGRLEVWVVAQLEDTLWPDALDGTDSAESWSSVDAKIAGAKLAAVIIASAATNDAVYPMAPVSVAQLFGGVCPRKFVVFVTHDIQTAANALAAAAAGPPQVNKMFVTPVTYTVA